MGPLLKPFICNQADIWFSGHSHHLEYRRLNSCKTDFVVAGGAGGDLYTTQSQDNQSLFISSNFGFVFLKVDPLFLKTTFYNDQGQILKEITH